MEYIGICANQIKDPSPLETGYPAHSHDSYELFIPLIDSLGFEVADYCYTIKRGDLLLLPPNVIHRLVVTESEPLEYLYLQFTPRAMPENQELKDVVSALFDEHTDGSQSLKRLSKERFSYVYAAVKRLCMEGNREVHRQFFCILFPLLQEIQFYGVHVGGTHDEFIREDGSRYSLTDQIIDYISRQYADIRDLSFIYEVFHYSTVHANTLFKTRMGVSLWHYILHIRLDRACDLLLAGARAEETATACGFGDYSTFYRIFKKCYGMTPSECRRLGYKPKLVQ